MKRAIIVHGWEGYPEEGWFPWLEKQLQQRGFEVIVPRMPDPDKPRIIPWLNKLSEEVSKVDEDTYFVGHSMGCQTIIRFLETLPENIIVGGAVFVGGWFKRLTNLDYESEIPAIKKEWLDTPVNFEKAKTHLSKSIAIFSSDDPWVPIDNQEEFKDKLDSEIIVVDGMGHFSGSQGIVELPIALDSILKIAK